MAALLGIPTQQPLANYGRRRDNQLMAHAFDYRTASEEEILAKADELEGRLLGSIPGALFTAATGATGRGEAGHAIETHFGIPPNSSPEPDFPGAGIELKVVPLRRTGRGLGVKERTTISQIDYLKLVEQTWATASVRKKLKILFVFFEHLANTPKELFPVREVFLWKPDDRMNALLRADWERVFVKVRQGRAHELSESDGTILGPCTKGATGASIRKQPLGMQEAKSRAWALKARFTRTLYEGASNPKPSESLLENIGLDAAAEFEQRLLERFKAFEGRSVEDVGTELGIPRSDAKSYTAAIVHRIFGAKSVRTRIVEFEEMGLTQKTTRVNNASMPYEAISFPAFRYASLIDETWDESDLVTRIEYMLFVPVHGSRRTTPQRACTFLTPVFWRPSASQLDLIRREWELFRIEIERGLAERLTPASETQAIHVRPHGRRGMDTDEAPVVGPVTKKCFWLNKSFVQRILVEAGGS